MSIKTLILILKTPEPVKEDASKLRGYIGNEFKGYPILHHHIEDAGYVYTYPKVQYKIIGGTPIILGIEEGRDVLLKISDDITELRLGNSRYKIESIQMNQMNAEFGDCRENYQYRFLTPWLALNPDNYQKFGEIGDWKDRKIFLNSILVGNILSMCKGLDFVVDRQLYVHSYLDETTATYKGIPHLGFMDEFRVNFKIPTFFGIGKGVSQGFGTVTVKES
jgi:hypothetical protein